MNDVDKIYDKFGKNFCVCPFVGGFYKSHQIASDKSTPAPDRITPCSLITPGQSSDQFNIINNNILDSINQPVWKEMRQKFVAGHNRELSQCKICHDNEDAGILSPRQGANLHHAHHCKTDIVEQIDNIIDNDYTVDKILSLDWYPSNYCNYSCIMCSGGASSSRMTFEIKITRQNQKIVVNTPSSDFYDVIKSVEIINFTGGETLMQQQVHHMIDYLVDNNLASNKTIFLLTNASNYPEQLIEKFKQFRKVIYMCSIDGIGPVIEYQRRGARWQEVEQNSLRILKHESIASVINLVLTAVNVLNITDFVNWVYHNNITRGISVSPVFRAEHLGLSSLPPELKNLALDRIDTAISQYQTIVSQTAGECLQVLNSVKSVLAAAEFDPKNFNEFRKKILIEDSASRVPLYQVVPEWEPYFRPFVEHISSELLS